MGLLTTEVRRTRRSPKPLFVFLLFAILVAFAVPPGRAQNSGRRLTTIDALRRFSGYFHLQNVVLRGELVENGKRISLRGGDSEMQVMLAEDVRSMEGPVEVRAQLIDIGRLTPSDPRLGRYESKPDPEHWPQPGEELVLNVTGIAKADPESSPTVRSIALEPWKYEGQTVSLTGQFGGRNLFGDVPAAPAKNKYDFVLRNPEGAVWVTGMRPKGKGFDLNVDARVDTSQWLQVSGTVRRDRGLVLVEAKTMMTAQAPAARPVVAQAPPPPSEPGEIVFSSPTDGETNVGASAPVRVQFSRGIDPMTLNGHFRFTYLGGAPPAGTMDVQANYDVGSHAVVLRLSKPLEAFRTVKLELLEGVKTFDGAPVKPWSVTFSVGAN